MSTNPVFDQENNRYLTCYALCMWPCFYNMIQKKKNMAYECYIFKIYVTRIHVTIVLKDINNLLLFERYTYMESTIWFCSKPTARLDLDLTVRSCAELAYFLEIAQSWICVNASSFEWSDICTMLLDSFFLFCCIWNSLVICRDTCRWPNTNPRKHIQGIAGQCNKLWFICIRKWFFYATNQYTKSIHMFDHHISCA